MKLNFLLLSFFVWFQFSNSQVGIGNTNPQSSLDISSSSQNSPSNNDGILIPRIDIFPSTNPTINQQSMLVYVTGNGTAIKGFYYWDNPTTSWIPFGGADSDWYEESTTTHPNNINDDIYTQGNVAIGKTTAAYSLDVYENDKAATAIRVLNENANPSIDTYGIHIENRNGGGRTHYGTKNLISGEGTGKRYAIYNEITNPNAGYKYGVFNSLLLGSSRKYGMYNDFATDSGRPAFGVFNNFNLSGAGEKTGLMNNIFLSSSSAGQVNGVSNTINAPGGAGKINGYSNVFTLGAGAGATNGVYNEMNIGGGAGAISGVRNIIETGDGAAGQYGIYNRLNHGGGAGSRYGVYSVVSGTTGAGHQYGVYSSTSEAGSYAGYFVGDVYTTGSYLPSARILKSNIKRSASVINKIMNLKVKTYKYNTKKYHFMNLPENDQTGFIAEEIQKEFPELVKKNRHPKQVKEGKTMNEAVDFIAVNYTGLVPHLVKGMQEQQATINKQNKIIQSLLELEKSNLKRIEALENIINK